MLKILIVDDDVMSLEFLKIFLEGEGHSVETASGMSEIMPLLDHFTPEMLISDLNLGEESGADIISYIKTKCPAVKIIVITGYDKNQIESSIEYDFLIRKPVDLNNLQQTISNIIKI